MNPSSLPIKRDLSQPYTFSIISAILMTVTSLAGIVFQSLLYASNELRQSFVANDILNLMIGLPFVLGSVWFARRGKWIGLLFLPGALFYIAYNYIAYSIAMIQTWLVLPSLCLVAVSAYAIFLTLSRMDMNFIKTTIQNNVPARFAGGVLIVFGLLFFARSISQVAGLLTGQITLVDPEFGVQTADLLTTPIWVIGGFQLWRKHPLGYAAATGLLFQASMLFVGLLLFFILQPLLFTLPFRLEDFVVILVMGLFFFIPFGLFVRGIPRN